MPFVFCMFFFTFASLRLKAFSSSKIMLRKNLVQVLLDCRCLIGEQARKTLVSSWCKHPSMDKKSVDNMSSDASATATDAIFEKGVEREDRDDDNPAVDIQVHVRNLGELAYHAHSRRPWCSTRTHSPQKCQRKLGIRAFCQSEHPGSRSVTNTA